jgi:Zn-dependent peptidase ImmA (M78 family)/transcriptional regulator with XRE-family HTH domain
MKMTLAEVAERTTIALASLSEFENGKRDPRLVQLRQLADVYRRPIAFFLDESDVPTETVLWRNKPGSPHLEETRADLLRLSEQYHNLELWCEDCQDTNLPNSSAHAQAFSYTNAQGLAYDFRNRYSLGDMPGQTLLRVVEEVCKVKVFHLEFDPSGSAACTLSERTGAAILLNARNVHWKRNFDLAHELFHLLTWNVFGHATADNDEPSEREEKLATCFARNLLMPPEALKNAVGAQLGDRKKLNVDDMLELARQFDVSVEALLWQLSFVYSIPDAKIRSTLECIRSEINYWDDPRRDVKPPVRPYRFLALARQALRKGEISTGRYAEYVGISRREAATLIEQDVEQDAEVEITDL